MVGSHRPQEAGRGTGHSPNCKPSTNPRFLGPHSSVRSCFSLSMDRFRRPESKGQCLSGQPFQPRTGQVSVGKFRSEPTAHHQGWSDRAPLPQRPGTSSDRVVLMLGVGLRLSLPLGEFEGRGVGGRASLESFLFPQGCFCQEH